MIQGTEDKNLRLYIAVGANNDGDVLGPVVFLKREHCDDFCEKMMEDLDGEALWDTREFDFKDLVVSDDDLKSLLSDYGFDDEGE